MALTLYLAMTGAEMRNCSGPPAHSAWMACHFSPYSSGISNVPPLLMPGSMLILNDRIPPQGHDPDLVAEQLLQAAQQLEAERVLLDFQRSDDPQTAAIAAAVTQALPCPVGVTDCYAADLSCPVFITPLLHKPLSEQLAAWHGREIWLETAQDCVDVILTEEGSRFQPTPLPGNVPVSHADTQLHCRYCITQEDTFARFTIWRDVNELKSLLAEAEELGIQCAVGLYQQLRGAEI